MHKTLLIETPSSASIGELRKLWKDTFGDTDAFLDMFFQTAFSSHRCLLAKLEDSVVAALYWFDCAFANQKIAYIYAVATAEAFRGQGICHKLMEHTHLHLKKEGYAGAILSPAEESLFPFYKKMGYKTCAYVNELHYNSSLIFDTNNFELTAASTEHMELGLRQISKTEFAKLRRTFLPETAVIQEHENLDFLEQQASFYAGNGFLLTAYRDEVKDAFSTPHTHLYGIEFLGDKNLIPCILHTLSCASATVRTIGTEKPFGMYYSFTETTTYPTYLGFVFD